MMLLLERVEIQLGFHKKIVDLIMTCVTSMKYTVRFNGREMDCFIPCMGLRRGDPSPPYLFHICVECLSSALLIQRKSMALKVFGVCRNAPPFSHLSFVDVS